MLNTVVVGTVTDDGLQDVTGRMVLIEASDEESVRQSAVNLIEPLEVAKMAVRKKTGVEELRIEPETQSVG